MTYQEIPNYISEVNNSCLVCFPILKSKRSQYSIQKRIFARYPEFKKKLNKIKVGDCVGYSDLQQKKNFVAMCVKNKKGDKINYDDLNKTFYKLKDLVVTHKFSNIALPYLGVEDNLDWFRVAYILQGVFYDVSTNIFICSKSIS